MKLLRLKRMPLAEVIEYVKAGGGIAAPLLLLALIWMNKQREEAREEAKETAAKLADLSERTIVLLTELKGMVTKRS